MDERIVVCLAVQGPHPTDYVQRVNSLMTRASAFGAIMCASGWEGIAFAFHRDDVDEAVEFARASDATDLIRPFCVGIARGEWRPLTDHGATIELGFGPALFRARAVASLARSGEVLLEEGLDPSRRFPVVSPAPRTASVPLPIKAVALAAACFEPSDRRVQVRFEQAPFVGRSAALDVAAGDPGTLATLRAAPGMGGTRLLQECAHAAPPAATLVLHPYGASVEPLGALRFTLAREIALFRTRPVSDASAATLAALVEGRGASIEAAAKLLEEWLDGSTPGLLLIDDANDVDASSLEVVACSLLGASRPFRAVARLDAESPLPAGLALLAPGPEITAGPLMPGDMDRIASCWLGCALDDNGVRSLVASADGSPLVLRERLAHALARGDIEQGAESAKTAAGYAPRRDEPALQGAIRARFDTLSPGGKAVLRAVAMLGGDALDEAVSSLVESAADVPVDLADEVRSLVASGWLEETQPGWLGLPSRSHARIVLADLREDRWASWHRAASLSLEMHGTGLTCAEAAWHAAMAGDDRRALRLAGEAARIAKEAQLESAAQALTVLASSPARWTAESGSSPSVADASGLLLTVPPTPDQALAARLVAHGRAAAAGDSYVPIDVPEAIRAAEAATQPEIPPAPRPADPARLAPPTQAVPPAPRPCPATTDEPRTVPRPKPFRPQQIPTTEPAPAPCSSPARPTPQESAASLPAIDVDRMATTLPLVAREALQSGDEHALEQWIADLITSGKSPRLVERMRAIAALRGRDPGKAIATLREACVQARSLGLVERSRSHLALAVGLAHVGRLTDALIEGLEALSRAREASDQHAERACLRFLEQLYAAAGQPTPPFALRRTDEPER